jgi:hypothetical protein
MPISEDVPRLVSGVFAYSIAWESPTPAFTLGIRHSSKSSFYRSTEARRATLPQGSFERFCCGSQKGSLERHERLKGDESACLRRNSNGTGLPSREAALAARSEKI